MTIGGNNGALVSAKQRNEVLEVDISGRLTATTVPQVWGSAVDRIRLSEPRQVIVDGARLTFCDGAGLALFAEIRRTIALLGGTLTIQGLAPELAALVERAALPDPIAPQLRPPAALGFISEIGKASINFLLTLRGMVAFLGEVLAALSWGLIHPQRLRWRDVLSAAQRCGVDAVPVISLLGFLIGEIVAYQVAIAIRRFGAIDIIPTVVTVAMLRELGPLITAVLLAGRSGSAFAAEIGTMKVTEEVSALRTFGLNPVRFLAVPRVLAAVFVTPALCMYCNLLGLVGGYTVMASYGYTFPQYVSAVRGAAAVHDLVGGLLKTVVFAFIVASIGCLRGLRTGVGPGAVGDSTTRAVVAGIILVIVADCLFGVAYFYLGV